MHVMIINGSPRVRQYSNTEKIINAFAEGLAKAGASFEKYAISERNSWEEIREAYLRNDEIIFAMPLYVENVPGLLLEFLETLPVKDQNTRVSFILQGGFAEASQLRCGETFLKTLPEYLGVRYGGTLIKGDNFGLRLMDPEEWAAKRITAPFLKMGTAFAEDNGFSSAKIRKVAGSEYLSPVMRLLYEFIFKTLAKKSFNAAAAEWGCTVPLDDKPWE